MNATRYAYQAVAQYSNRDAGHVCYGISKDEARERARRRTTMSIAVRRVRVSPEHYAQIATGDAAANDLSHRI